MATNKKSIKELNKSNLPDTQGLADTRNLSINKVGIKDILHPMIIKQRSGKNQTTVANFNMYVNLPHNLKGTHMSRFVHILNNHEEDLVQNYAYKQFGEEKKIVLSEHGGYIIREKGIYDGEAIAAEIANAHFQEDSFENEIKKRSIVNTLMIQSIMANTLTFMDHPHVIQKAVPFVLPKSWEWDKKYYAQLYVPYDYSDTSIEVPTHLVNFFRFFRGVEGRANLQQTIGKTS